MMNPGGGKVSLGHDHGAMISGEVEDLSEHAEMDMEKTEIKVNAEFKKQLQKVYDSYNEMKNAFVASDAKEVRENAEKVKSSLAGIDMGLLEGDAHMIWMEQVDILESEVTVISDGKDISSQRISFAVFNDAFYSSLKTFGLHHGTVYYQYCPMANGDKGAFWLSNIEEIENPYFGDDMLKCGETRETLEF